MDVVANIVKAEGIRGVTRDMLGACLPARRVVRERLGRIVAPGELLLFEAATGGALPFGFTGQTEGASSLRTQPLAVANRFKPADSGNGLLGMVEVWVLPERRRQSGGCTQEAGVLGVGDLRGREQEGIDPDAMNGAFAVLAGVGTHQKPAFRDPDKSWRDGFDRAVGRGLRLCWSKGHGGCRCCGSGLEFTSVAPSAHSSILAEMLYNFGNIVFLEEADSRDAGGTGFKAGVRIGKGDSAES